MANSFDISKARDMAMQFVTKCVTEEMLKLGLELLEYAANHRGFFQFTGNAIESLGVGVYVDNNLIGVYFYEEGLSIMDKVPAGRWVYLANPVEGKSRSVYGAVNIVEAHGKDLTMRTLAEVRPYGGTGIVVANGIEYAEYLEIEKGKPVLSETFEYTEAIAYDVIKTAIKNKK